MKEAKISIRKIQIGVLVAFAIFSLFIWYIVLSGNHTNSLRVTFLDVGQGDAILIQAPNGNRVLVDGGVSSARILPQLGAVLPFYDRQIDAIIATHPDMDHIGGIPELFKRYSVQVLFEPDVYSGNGVYGAMEINAEKFGAQKIIARSGILIKLDKNTTLQILYPEKKSPPNLDTNASSVVVRVIYGNTSFLLTGDLPSEQENLLALKYGIALHSTVLKFGHHGSKTASSPEFLAMVSPDYGVVSVGAENKYGHPNKEVLDLAEKDKIKVLRTDTMGRIEFISDGTTVSVSEQK